MRSLVVCAAMITSATLSAADSPQDAFWKNLRALCGQAFEGHVVEGSAATEATFKDKVLVMHVRACGDDEIRIPFHVGENRSRTWVLTRTAGGIRLKHDHRHEDGSEDNITQYGGDTSDGGTAEKQEFPADEFTTELIPAAKTNIWTMIVEPGKIFGYGLRREAENRRFRVEFDLTRPVSAPPAPWGSK